MNQVTTIGLDIAKSIFQVHGVDAAEQSVLRQRFIAKPGAGVLWQTATMSGWPRGAPMTEPFFDRLRQERPKSDPE
jgi:hypothetical protein